MDKFNQKFKLSTLEALIGSLIVLGLIYVGYLIFFQGDAGSSTKLEKKVKILETISLQQQEKLQSGMKTLLESQAQTETRLKNLEAQQKQLDTAYKELVAKAGRLEKRPTEEKKPTTPAPAPGKNKIIHKAKPGENIYSIARKYKVNTQDLIKWNKLAKDKPIKVGDTLVVYTN